MNLNDIASDFRLYDLFGEAEKLSATKLWMLEIKRTGTTVSELRFLYGITQPCTYQSDEWTGTSSSTTSLYDGCTVRTHVLTLHTSANKLKEFLQRFFDGKNLQDASQFAALKLHKELMNTTIGSLTFGAKPTVRPVMHLPARDYFQNRTNRLSQTSFASADSGAVFAEEKSSVFAVQDDFDHKIAKAVCKELDDDTGMKFTTLDAWRLGDFEFICMPGLTKSKQRKFEIDLKCEKPSLKLSESLTREPTELLIVLKVYSDDMVQYSYIYRIHKDASYPFEHAFTIEQLNLKITTAFTLEAYACNEVSGDSYLVLQAGNYILRNMNMNINVVNPIRLTDTFSWLDKRVPDKQKARLDEAGTVTRAVHTSRSKLGGHIDDPWIDQNRLVENKIHELLPKPSQGKFFLKLSDGGGMSRVYLTEWLRSIFVKYPSDAQVAWIDPFMEDVGIELINRMGTNTGDYLIITTAKQSKSDGNGDAIQKNRIEQLLEKCVGWNNGYFGNVQLKVLTVPDSKIHDRLILIRTANGLPLAGYHLSNSIQRATENFPLLVTPIPLDVLPDVFEFADMIIKSTLHVNTPSAKIIFDSKTYSSQELQNTEGLNNETSFVNVPRLGEVLAWWLSDSDLKNISGPDLFPMMQSKGYIEEYALDSHYFDTMPSKFWNEGLPLNDFHTAWDAVGYVVAWSQSGDSINKYDELPILDSLKQHLLEYINPSRINALPPKINKSLPDILEKNIRDILLSNVDPNQVFRCPTTKTSYGDYYAIKILWSRAPQDLVNWLKTICSSPINENPRKQALVVQSFQHICLTLGFDQEARQIDALLTSNVCIVTWIGIHALKNAIINRNFDVEMLSKLDFIELREEKETILCWLINEANYRNSDIKSQLVSKLTESISEPLVGEQLQDILLPLRSHLGKLHHHTPWILTSLLIPMLEMKLVDVAQVAKEWFAELTDQWKKVLSGDKTYVSFTFDGDGAFTDEVAVLIVHLASQYQEKMIKAMYKEFRCLAQIILDPMSANRNWTLYSNTHKINLWLVALSRRIRYLVNNDLLLDRLLKESELLIERLPISDGDSVTNRDLLRYFDDAPDKIKTHPLQETIRCAINITRH